eukprot:CAMPEP_0202697066 /NCGR_PEP_ID=MMETSP1385-20130828/10403_1 /ASSEMBLY_ACC=CAM_ASM_000861 /TAXON_ID=933848 /ORGANISM="Elphidium margaritaceum" /LENGTH=120 /DNA_ID=CAMNT_0049353429 /DNA_START=27 /DNA_END=386 /DNA_ORIENTATION=+
MRMSALLTLLLLVLIDALTAFSTPIIHRLHGNGTIRAEDVCSGCDEQLCDDLPSCGYVEVKNSGAYVAKICVNGLNNETHSQFCCSSGGFDVGQTAQIKLPCNGLELTMSAEEDIFIDSW